MVASFFKEERDPFYKRGEKIGKKRGELKGKETEVQNLITKLGLSDEQAADVAEVSVEFVAEIRANLAKKPN